MPVPPISVVTLLTVPVLVPLARVRVLPPAAQIHMHAVGQHAAQSDGVCRPPVPMIDVVFATVAVLVKLLKVILSLPLPLPCRG